MNPNTKKVDEHTTKASHHARAMHGRQRVAKIRRALAYLTLPAWMIATTASAQPVVDGFKKLKRPQDAEKSEPMAVRWIDADMNGHANLACYVGWAVEAHDHAFLDSHEPAQLHMEFRAETKPGERVISVTDGVTQSLIRESDGAELARLRMEWR